MNYNNYIHSFEACPLKEEECVNVLKQKNLYTVTTNCLGCTGDSSNDRKRINRAYNCVLRRYDALQFYIHEIEIFYISKFVQPFFTCLLYKFYLELSKIKKLPPFSTPEFNKMMNEETLRCQDRLNDYVQHLTRFINYLKHIASLLQSVIDRCKLPDQSYAQQYIIKRRDHISQYGRYLEKDKNIIISETYNNLMQDGTVLQGDIVVNKGWNYFYYLRRYMKRFISSHYKDQNFIRDECLLCNIKKITNHVYPIDLTMKELKKCKYYGNDICLDMITILHESIIDEGRNYQKTCTYNCMLDDL